MVPPSASAAEPSAPSWKGDRSNSVFFETHLPLVYERRVRSGLEDLVGTMAAIVIQVEHGQAIPYLGELALLGPYRYRECWLNETHRIFLLAAAEQQPRLILLEPLSKAFSDQISRWNLMYPLAARTPNARYVGEIFQTASVGEVRRVLEEQNIRFVYRGETDNPFYALPHLLFSVLSDYTYNRVGYCDVPLDSLAALNPGDRVMLDGQTLAPVRKAARLHGALGLGDKVLGVDHLATRVLAGERDDALLEFLTMVPYRFWGAYNITEMNSSTNITRCPGIGDEKRSPAKVFTANNIPSYLNSIENLPMPTEEFVRNFGRRMHHMAYEILDGQEGEVKNVDLVVRHLRDQGVSFLSTVVGECRDQPNLKQIFTRSSAFTLLITEYIQRCMGYDGFFTRENVAALTEAAGYEERYQHGQVFD